MSSKHYLLTGLGITAKETTYVMAEEPGGPTRDAKLTPLALMHFLEDDERPTHVLTLVTDGAEEETWPHFSDQIREDWGIEATKLSIDDGKNLEEVRAILEQICEAVPAGSELTLDVTQGFRHFPFITYAAALYLASLQDVDIRGAYYGMFDNRELDKKPIVDVEPLLELPEWFYAVRVFKESGSAEPMCDLLDPRVKELRQQKKRERESNGLTDRMRRLNDRRKQLGKIANNFRDFTRNYGFGLPVELGQTGEQLLGALSETELSDFLEDIPLVDMLEGQIKEVAEPLALNQNVKKKNLTLADSELTRQALVIDQYLERGQYLLASGLMREWIISLGAYTLAPNDWLDKDLRYHVTGRLGAMAAHQRNKEDDNRLRKEQLRIARMWGDLTQVRNDFHHYGMGKEPVDTSSKLIDRIQNHWNNFKKRRSLNLNFGGGSGGLLVTASETAGQAIDALTNRDVNVQTIVTFNDRDASFESTEDGVEVIKLAADCTSYDNLNRQKLIECTRPHMHKADKILINLTADTSTATIAAQYLAETAGQLTRSARRFVLTDSGDNIGWLAET